MAVQRIDNTTQVLTSSEQVKNDASKAVAWVVAGATGFVAAEAVKAFIPNANAAEKKQILDVIDKIQCACIAGAGVGTIAQTKDLMDRAPGLDPLANTIKQYVVGPTVDGVLFAGNGVVYGINYIWIKTLQILGQGKEAADSLTSDILEGAVPGTVTKAVNVVSKEVEGAVSAAKQTGKDAVNATRQTMGDGLQKAGDALIVAGNEVKPKKPGFFW